MRIERDEAAPSVRSQTLSAALWTRGGGDGSVTILAKEGEAGRRPWAEILDEAQARSAGLRDRIEPGARVGAIASTSFDFIVAALTVIRSGAALVPLPARSRGVDRGEWQTTIEKRLSTSKAALMIVGKDDSGLDLSTPTVAVTDIASHGSSVPIESVRPSDTALILFSSGSTSDPKGVVLSHRAMGGWFGGPRRETTTAEQHLRWAPLHFAGGLSPAIFRPIASKCSVTLMPPQLLVADPSRWLLEISRRRITHTGGPNFAFALAAREIEKGLPEPIDLSSWWDVQCGGGEAPDHSTVERFTAMAKPLGFDPLGFTAAYALTETGVISRVPRGAGLSWQHLDRDALADGQISFASDRRSGVTIASAGPPVEGVDLRILSDQGEDLPEERIGEVVARTPTMMDGYLDDTGHTDNLLKEGWLRTGDLGYIHGGELFITGRSKDVIIVRGANVHAEDIERVARGSLGPGDKCAAFGVRSGGSETVVLAVERSAVTAAEDDRFHKEIVRAVWSSTGLVVKEVILFEPGSLPTTATGKPRRALIKERYEAAIPPDPSTDRGRDG